jgi:serine/threonine-protein kinase HipA
MHHLLDPHRYDADPVELDEITYLLESGSDRIGALDFQRSPSEYAPRLAAGATLEELLASAERVELGLPLSPELDQALNHGTAIGGARRLLRRRCFRRDAASRSRSCPAAL